MFIPADFGRSGAALLYPANGEHDCRIDPFALLAVGVDQPGNEGFSLGVFSQPLLIFGIDFGIEVKNEIPIPR